jgi:UrcA family protein
MSHDRTIKSHFISVTSILAGGFFVFAGAAMGNAVRAAEVPRYDKTTVAYGDLNLDSQQGTKVLYARLRNGAEVVCSSFESRDMSLRRLWQTCFDQAVAAAVVEVNKPGLTMLHKLTVNRSTVDP